MKHALLVLIFVLGGCVHSVKAPAAPETTRASEHFSHPLPGARLLSPFGQRGRRFHTGVDLQKGRRGGEAVIAARDGVVTRAGTMSGYGQIVEIRHADGFSTRYAHLQKILVKKKQKVRRREKIGTVGRTGRASTPHLHFEILSPKFRYVNPKQYIGN